MTDENSQGPLNLIQCERITMVLLEEAHRVRIAAQFLPMIGPLPPETDFVRMEKIVYGNSLGLVNEDRTTLLLATLQVNVQLRGAQIADPNLTSALSLFRRAANGLARLEDALIFNGSKLTTDNNIIVPGSPNPSSTWRIICPQLHDGLYDVGLMNLVKIAGNGQKLVNAISKSIGQLEAQGHFGPFALVLGQYMFNLAQTPDPNSLVLPQDRIIPFLGGGQFMRCSALPELSGVIISLGGSPVELIVATDMSFQFLQTTADPAHIFRVFERIALRVKDPSAIATMEDTNHRLQTE